MKHLKNELKVLESVCEVKALYSAKLKPSERIKICQSRDLETVLRPFYESLGMIEQKEVFSVVFLNTANKLLAIAKISEGAVDATVVDVPYIFRLAVLVNAKGIIMCHNHPSGNMNPSEPDRRLTKNVQSAAELFNMIVLDHLILSPETGKYYSFADNGLL